MTTIKDYCLILSNDKEEIQPISAGLSLVEHALKLKIKNSIEETIYDKNYLKKGLKEYISQNNNLIKVTDDEEGIETIETENEFAQSLLNNPLDVFKKAEFISLDINGINEKELMKKEIFKDKKFKIDGYFTTKDLKKIEKLHRYYYKYKDRVYISLEGNTEPTSIEEAYKTVNIIKQEADIIKKLNPSPMESIVYAYDLVRDRKYKEDRNNPMEARNLSEILNQDKIVCLGYARHLEAILKHLNINCKVIILINQNDNIHHARCIIYVKDPKYNIDGVYCFDPTWESNKGNNNYLNQYFYFAKTINWFDENDNNKYNHDFLGIEELMNSVYKMLESKQYKKIGGLTISNINSYSYYTRNPRLVDSRTLLPFLPNYEKFDLKEIRKNMDKVIKAYNNPIPAETMIRLINNVRKLEFYSNPDKYQYNIDALYKIFVRSKWVFEKDQNIEVIRLLSIIFGEELDKTSPRENFKKFVRQEGILEDIEGVRFTKTLQLIAKQKERQ